MAERLVLHLGTTTSGTSFLQTALLRNARLHEEQGDFLYVGGSVQPPTAAVRQVLERARAHPSSTVVVSQGLAGSADEIDAFLAEIEGFKGFRVEVVLTLRDQLSAIPAQWQSSVRNQGTVRWSSYLRRTDPARRPEDVAAAIRRWAGHPAVSRLSAVTVPLSDAPDDELWHRFCGAAGVVSTLAYLGARRDRTTLGYASCDVLRRVNLHLGPLAPQVRRGYRDGMAPVIHGVLAQLRTEEADPRLDRGGQQLALHGNEEIRAAIAGHPLFGSLDDLPVAAVQRAPRRAEQPDRRQVRRAMGAVWEHLARETGRSGRVPRRLEDAAAQVMEMAPATQAWRDGVASQASELPARAPLA